MKYIHETMLAEAVRARCLEAALEAYESAGMAGLCADGRWEAAIGAIRSLDLRFVIESGCSREDDAPSAGESDVGSAG